MGGVSIHTLEFGKNKKNAAISPQNPRKYCYLGVKSVSSKK